MSKKERSAAQRHSKKGKQRARRFAEQAVNSKPRRNCPSAKNSYRTASEARSFERNFRRSNPNEKKARPYKCQHCPNWHLTTQEKK